MEAQLKEKQAMALVSGLQADIEALQTQVRLNVSFMRPVTHVSAIRAWSWRVGESGPSKSVTCRPDWDARSVDDDDDDMRVVF